MNVLLPSEYPPDYISIPEHLRSRSLDSFVVPSRLKTLFLSTQFRTVGELHGKRISDFNGYRGCGQFTRALLREFIRGLQPKGKRWVKELPMLMSEYKSFRHIIVVPERIESIKVNDLPLSSRLQRVLRRMRIERLGDLHGKDDREVRGQPSCGPQTFDELGNLLQRAAKGQLSFNAEALK